MNNNQVLTVSAIFKSEAIMDQFIKVCLDTDHFETRMNSIRQSNFTFKSDDLNDRRLKEQDNQIKHFIKIFDHLDDIEFMYDTLRHGQIPLKDSAKARKLFERIKTLHNQQKPILYNARVIPKFIIEMVLKKNDYISITFQSTESPIFECFLNKLMASEVFNNKLESILEDKLNNHMNNILAHVHDMIEKKINDSFINREILSQSNQNCQITDQPGQEYIILD